MRKQDAPPTFFVDGPTLEPARELRRWVEERSAGHPRGLLRLPFTFEGEATNRAALGLPGPSDAGWVHRLADPALGVSLADRLWTLRPEGAGRYAVWLSVRMGALFGAADPDGPPVASVFAVHERVEDAARARDLCAQAARGADDLAVRRLGQGHCARGPMRCKTCKEMAARPASPALLDLSPDDPQAARPTIGVERGGRTVFRAYDVLRRFASDDEARAFAARYQLSDVRLEADEP